MCFENIINWRRLTYISVSVCIKINKIISLQIDLIVPHCQGWSLDRDKFPPIAHRRDELFNTSHFKAKINAPIQRWMETTISIPSTSNTSREIASDSSQLERFNRTAVNRFFIQSDTCREFNEHSMQTRKLRKISTLWNSENLRNIDMKVRRGDCQTSSHNWSRSL